MTTSNRTTLYNAILEGDDGLLSLAQRVARISLNDMRRLHGLKYDLLNPLSRTVDIETGPESVRILGQNPDDWQLTIVDEPEIAMLNYWIYRELFQHDFERNLSGSTTYKRWRCPDLKTRRR